MASTVKLYRVSVADDEFASAGWRRTHFASEAEADIAQRAAVEMGLTCHFHEVEVPTDANLLANWLDAYRGAGCAPLFRVSA